MIKASKHAVLSFFIIILVFFLAILEDFKIESTQEGSNFNQTQLQDYHTKTEGALKSPPHQAMSILIQLQREPTIVIVEESEAIDLSFIKSCKNESIEQILDYIQTQTDKNFGTDSEGQKKWAQYFHSPEYTLLLKNNAQNWGEANQLWLEAYEN